MTSNAILPDHNLELPSLHLTPDIVTVDASGKMTMLKLGYGFILEENQGAEAHIRVNVADEAGTRPPSIEKTSSAVISASGFRRDPKTGFFVQEVTIKNNSKIPFSKGLTLAVRDLPKGVRLENSVEKTRNSAPTGAPMVWVDVQGRDFLSPGNTASAVFKFSNRNGVLITYSTHLYCGNRP